MYAKGSQAKQEQQQGCANIVLMLPITLHVVQFISD